MCTLITSHRITRASSFLARVFLNPTISSLTYRFYLVYFVFFCETVQTGLNGADVYYWFVSGFGNMNHLSSPYVSPFDVPILGAMVSVTIQFFFSYRLYLLSNKEGWWLSALICLVSPPCRIRLLEVLIVFAVFRCRCNFSICGRHICELSSHGILRLAHRHAGAQTRPLCYG